MWAGGCCGLGLSGANRGLGLLGLLVGLLLMRSCRSRSRVDRQGCCPHGLCCSLARTVFAVACYFVVDDVGFVVAAVVVALGLGLGPGLGRCKPQTEPFYESVRRGKLELKGLGF